MLEIILWIFIAYGITSIVMWGSIFDGVRRWIKIKSKFIDELINCTLCTSTWVGFFLSIFLKGLTTATFGTHWLIGIFFDGMFAAGAVWALNSLIEFFEENRFK